MNTWIVSPDNIHIATGHLIENLDLIYYKEDTTDSITYSGKTELHIITEKIEYWKFLQYLFQISINPGPGKFIIIHNKLGFNSIFKEMIEIKGYETFINDCNEPKVILSDEYLTDYSKKKDFILTKFILISSVAEGDSIS